MATTAAAAATAPADVPAPGKKKGKLVPMMLGVVLLAGAGGGGWYFMNHKSHAEAGAGEEGHGAEAAKAGESAVFVPMEGALVVNLEDEDAMRFMQVEVQIAVHDPKAVDVVKNNMPILRNRLMLLFSGQHYRDLNTRAAKEKLQADALAEAQKVMSEVSGKPQIDSLYFTSLVMQ